MPVRSRLIALWRNLVHGQQVEQDLDAELHAAFELFRGQQAAHATRLAEYEQLLASLQREEDSVWEVNRPAFGNYATLHAGIEHERAAVAWCGWMVAQFERYQSS